MPSQSGRKICDFPRFDVLVLAMSTNAMNSLYFMLSGAGEFLPFCGLDDEYVGYRVLRKINALDLHRSKIVRDGDDVIELVDPVIVAEAVKSYDVFRCSVGTVDLFVSDRFKEIVESEHLSGFNFQKVRLI